MSANKYKLMNRWHNQLDFYGAIDGLHVHPIHRPSKRARRLLNRGKKKKL